MIQLAPVNVTYQPDKYQNQDMTFVRKWVEDITPAQGWELVFYPDRIEHREKSK